MTKLAIITFLLFLLFIPSVVLNAQNIEGFEIFVSDNSMTGLSFHSELSDSHFVEKNAPYKSEKLNSKAISLETEHEVKEPYTFVVTEGGRTHKFVILYKQDLDYAKLDNDFANLKQLTALINELKNKPGVKNVKENTTGTNNSTETPGADKKDRENFYALLSDGDKAKKNQQIEDAISKYNEALQIDPNSDYAQAQLQEAKMLNAKIKDAKYAEIISKANSAFYANDLSESIKIYGNALLNKPDDLFANAQIELAGKKLQAAKNEEDARQIEQPYNNSIKAGNEALAKKSYDAAVVAYNAALKIKPRDPIATGKLVSVDKQKHQDKEDEAAKKNEDLFNSFLNAGNKAIEEKSYKDAKASFNQAFSVKPNDIIVIAKLEFVNQILYSQFISSGNKSLQSKQFTQATCAYTEALTIRPNDAIAIARLTLVEQLKAEQEIDERFNAYVVTGDKALNDKSYKAAIAAFREALKIKPNNGPLMSKLSLIEKQIAQPLQEEGQKNENIFASYVAAGDKASNGGSFTEAKVAYNKALKMKPGDQLLTAKIDSINQLLYSNFVSAASQSLKEKAYNKAKDNYDEALRIKPNDTAVMTKIGLIETYKAQDQIEETFSNYMKSGDKDFTDGAYEQAGVAYSDAFKIKPNDSMVVAKLKSVNQNLYEAYMNGGNKLLQEKSFIEAKDAFDLAIKIRPGDTVVISKLSLLEQQKKQAEKQDEHNSTIAAGNKAFGEKEYDKARIYYSNALEIQHQDVYAASQIKKIDSLRASMKAEADTGFGKIVYIGAAGDAVREIEYSMVKIKEHLFKMGNNFGASDESPVHVVKLDSFYLGKYEVTQSQWQRIMGSNPSAFKNCGECPVENISWQDAMQFIQKLNAITNKKYRLPTEAEWEFVARSQSSKAKIEKVAWDYENSKNRPHPVGELTPNSLGCYDMLGNISELCNDWYDANFYNKSATSINPSGPESGKSKVVRGGSWYDMEGGVLVTARDNVKPDERNKKTGLRLALTFN